MSFPILKKIDFLKTFNDKIKNFKEEVKLNIDEQEIINKKKETTRVISDIEINNFSDVYLLPKLYLFYSKILYNFSLNTQKYYNIYIESNNIYKNINQYYFSRDNPFIEKMNIIIKNKDINLSIKKDINQMLNEINNTTLYNINIFKQIEENLNKEYKKVLSIIFYIKENISFIQKIKLLLGNITNNINDIKNTLSTYLGKKKNTI